MGNTLETTLSPALNEITAGNHVLVSQILAATVSASIVLISLRSLHNNGFFFSKVKKPVEWKRVGKVEKLYVFPIKGAKGSEQSIAHFGSLGMSSEDGLHDRGFITVSEKSGELLWTKHHPRLVLVQMVVEDGITCLKAPGMDDLTIDPKDLEYEKSREFTSKMQEVDIKLIFCGKVYDEWLSNFLLGKPSGVKLAYHYSDSPLRISRRKYVNKFNFKETDIPRMAFATPYSLLTWSSLEDLNQRLETPVSEINFRANLVIGPDEKIPYIEDQWRKRLRIGDEVILRYAKPCHRCMVTQVDPETGKLYEKGEPMKTLRKYRMIEPELNGPIFAVQFGIEVCGNAKVGDIVYAEI